MAKITLDTIGGELPAYLKSKATPAVLKLTMEQAYAIMQDGADWPKGFTQKDADALKDLYNQYLSAHSAVQPNAPFWNKTPETNQAFWSKSH